MKEDNISDISKCGLVLGNGEFNAIVYSLGKDIRLRLGKNDCWDMRADTQDDPALPVIDPATGKVTGHGAAPSWKKPYPTALPCAEVVLQGEAGNEVTSATLDLGKAVATVKCGSETATVRVLAQSNVLLINSERALSFAGILDFLKENNLDTWVSKSDLGTRNGYQYLHQNIPGDADASGMDIYVVAGKKGSTQAVAVVTSRESAQPLDDAAAKVTAALGDPSQAIAKHDEAWEEFWSKSGIKLGDVELQNWWYRMVYFFRAFSRSDGNAVGLAGCFAKLAGWHNSLKLNYNIQQTYLAAGPIGHPELLEPFIDVLNRNLPRARWFGSASFVGTEGAFFQSDLFPFEPDPAKCTTKYKHQITYLPWGYTLGMNGHSIVALWDYYKYSPTAKHLERIYPLIRELSLFYCSFLDKCALVDGKRRIGPSYFPELGGFNEYNVCYDISFITAGLKIAREAATLKGDKAFADRLSRAIDQLPSYGTTDEPGHGTVIEQWSGAKLGDGGPDRHGTLVQGIFPAGVINWFSSEDLKDLGKRTINRVEKSTTHANSNVTINIARARLGLGDEAIANAKKCFSKNSPFSKEQPNGFFFWNAHGYYMTEQVAVARFVTELLLQSVGDVIRIFPSWPVSLDAHFTDLLAQAGFAVSADQAGGTITDVRIHSNVGGTVKLLSPWGNQRLTVTEQGSNTHVPVATTETTLSFPTTAGMTYHLSPAQQ